MHGFIDHLPHQHYLAHQTLHIFFHAFWFLELAPHSMASATALLRSSADTPLSRLSCPAGRKVAAAAESDSFSSPSDRKLRALTTSVINGRTSGSSSRHIAATATACLKLFSGTFPFRRGSSSSNTLLWSLKTGFACKNALKV